MLQSRYLIRLLILSTSKGRFLTGNHLMGTLLSCGYDCQSEFKSVSRSRIKSDQQQSKHAARKTNSSTCSGRQENKKPAPDIRCGFFILFK